MKKQNVSQITKLIKENPKIVFLQDVYQSLGWSSSTFYRRFPKDSNEYNEITEALDLNKTSMKREIRDRLMECKSPVGLIVLYRLLGTAEERKILNQKEQEENENKTEIKLQI